MLITVRRSLIAGLGLTAALAVTPASRATAGPGMAVSSRTLSAVACPRAGGCWAVGSQLTAGLTSVLIERWSGVRWRVATSPGATSKDTFLHGVTCTSRSDCWAVGTAALGKTSHEPIAEHWNGRRWSLTVLAEPTGTASAELFGVSCPTAERCWAVGAIDPGTRSAEPLTEHWTGKRWSVVADRAGAGSELASVACRRDANCWAVGNNGGVRAPAEHWNGVKWSLAVTPDTAGGLNGVSCPGTDCLAVGFDGFPGVMAERWNGSKWSVMSTVQPTGSDFAGFGGLSCITSSDCFAVGGFTSASQNIDKSLIERLRGSAWVILRSPNPAGAGLAFLDGIACTSAHACWAVGQQGRQRFSALTRSLAEHWNGTRWSIVATP